MYKNKHCQILPISSNLEYNWDNKVHSLAVGYLGEQVRDCAEDTFEFLLAF